MGERLVFTQWEIRKVQTDCFVGVPPSRNDSKKLTERGATGGDAPKVVNRITGRPLTFPGGDHPAFVGLPRNMSVTGCLSAFTGRQVFENS